MPKFSDIQYMGYASWFEAWYTDKKVLIQTMIENMKADIAAGYNPNGECVGKQSAAIDAANTELNNQLDVFTEFNDDTKIDRWCYHDMLKRGVIA